MSLLNRRRGLLAQFLLATGALGVVPHHIDSSPTSPRRLLPEKEDSILPPQDHGILGPVGLQEGRVPAPPMEVVFQTKPLVVPARSLEPTGTVPRPPPPPMPVVKADPKAKARRKAQKKARRKSR